MTVEELIRELKALPKTAEVFHQVGIHEYAHVYSVVTIKETLLGLKDADKIVKVLIK